MAVENELKQRVVVEHREDVPHGEEGVVGFVAELEELPKGWFCLRPDVTMIRALTTSRVFSIQVLSRLNVRCRHGSHGCSRAVWLRRSTTWYYQRGSGTRQKLHMDQLGL